MGNTQNPIFHLGRQPALFPSSPAGLGNTIFSEMTEREGSCTAKFPPPPLPPPIGPVCGEVVQKTNMHKTGGFFLHATSDQRRRAKRHEVSTGIGRISWISPNAPVIGPPGQICKCWQLGLCAGAR